MNKLEQRIDLHKDLHWLLQGRLVLTYIERSEDFPVHVHTYPYQVLQTLSINHNKAIKDKVVELLKNEINIELAKTIKELDNDSTEK